MAASDLHLATCADEKTMDGPTHGAGADAPRRNLVVILDIDGPMIPATFLLVEPAAWTTRVFPRTTIAVMNRLCSATGARIVVNSTHSERRPDVPDIVDALVAHGLDRGHFHPTEPTTRYPETTRAEGAADWLRRHPEVDDWVAFDDVVFTQADNLIWVDPDAGLTLSQLNQALKRFGARPAIHLA